MKGLLLLLFSIFLIGCCEEQKLLKNGLTKKASKITEYTINVEPDSLNQRKQDTIVLTIKIYNENDQIINRNQQDLYADDVTEIEIVYNDQNRIQQEIVKLSDDSTYYIVHYTYKDTLLIETKSEIKNDIFHLKQIGWYKYNSDNELQEGSLKQIYIQVETNDTIINTLEIREYNEKKYVIQSKLYDFIQSERNRITKYNYDCGTLKKIREYNSKDSLVSTTEYKYEFDKFKNWIKRESFENSKLNYIMTREIDYK